MRSNQISITPQKTFRLLLLEQLQIQVREDHRDTQWLTRTDRGGRRPATSVRSASSAYLIDIFRCHHGAGTANANAANAGWNVNASADFPSEQKHAGKAEHEMIRAAEPVGYLC